MSHAYTIRPAKPAFGNFSKQVSYSEMMTNKRANALYCKCNQDDNPYVVQSQSQLADIRRISRNNCSDGCETFPFNKTNLEVNLITSLYTPNVVVLAKNETPTTPAKLDLSLSPIYAYYKLDPQNKLTGDTPCGIQKYVNYMILDVNAFLNVECPENVESFCYCVPSTESNSEVIVGEETISNAVVESINSIVTPSTTSVPATTY